MRDQRKASKHSDKKTDKSVAAATASANKVLRLNNDEDQWRSGDYAIADSLDPPPQKPAIGTGFIPEASSHLSLKNQQT